MSRNKRHLDLASEVAAHLAWQEQVDGWLEILPAVFDWDAGRGYQGEAALRVLSKRQPALGM